MAECKEWIEYLRCEMKQKSLFIAVGNKTDEDGEVGCEEAQQYFAAMNPPIHYFEASAKTGQGVNELFEEVMKVWQDGPDSFFPCNDNQAIEQKQLRSKDKKPNDDCTIC